jgi:hypothetical protein
MLVYSVCLGAVFKIKQDGVHRLAVSKRDHRAPSPTRWADAVAIEDHADVFKDLGLDEFAIVRIESRDDVVRITELFRAALVGDGDTATAGQAIKAKTLGSVMERAVRDMLKANGPILQVSGEPTYIGQDEITGFYDYKDLDKVRQAYADAWEGEDSQKQKFAVEAFNKFVDQVQPDDRLCWFEHYAPLACIS